MTFFTLTTKIKSFSVAAFLLAGSLLIINYGFAADPARNHSGDGDSVKTLKRIYSSMNKVIFSEIKTINVKQHVENKSDVANYTLTKN